MVKRFHHYRAKEPYFYNSCSKGYTHPEDIYIYEINKTWKFI